MKQRSEALLQVEPHIFFLDSRGIDAFGGSGVYLVIGDGITLIETGTTLIAPTILNSVAELGFKEKDIRRIIVTHIHLDHSGAVGWFVRRLPHLDVYVHNKGAKHLHDPSKLIESATMVFGNRDSVLDMHGEILPVPKERLIPITETELDIGRGIRLMLFDAPGHATHHMGIFEPESGCLFPGEALGHQIPELNSLQPAVAPPGFSLESSLATIGTIAGLHPKTICFSQYGTHRDPAFVIKQATDQLHTYHDLLLPYFRKGLDTNKIIQELLDHPKEDRDAPIRLSGPMLTSIVTGYRIYFERTKSLDRPNRLDK